MKYPSVLRRSLPRPTICPLVGMFIAVIACSPPAFAYVGPGLGLGVLGTLFGIFAAVVLALFGLFWYPLKRAFARKPATNQGTEPDRQDDSPPE